MIDDAYATRVHHCDADDCPLLPDALNNPDSNDDDELFPKPLTVRTAAPPCQDVSMTNHNGPGDSGASFAALSIMLAESAYVQDDFLFCECTMRFPVAMIKNAFSQSARNVHRLILRGPDIRDIVDRPRCCGLVIAGDVLLESPLEEFLCKAAHQPNADFDLNHFLCADRGELCAELLELRALRKVERTEDDPLFLSWREVLLPSQRTRLTKHQEDYTALLRLGKVPPGEPMIAELDQNPASSHGRLKYGRFPTLVTHGTWWHLLNDRPMDSSEKCRAHCWPDTSDEVAVRGAIASVRSLLLPKTVKCSSLTRMVEDVWHLKVQGTFLTWILANMVRRSEVSTIPKCLSLQAASSSGPIVSPVSQRHRCSGSPASVDTSAGRVSSRAVSVSDSGLD